MVILTYHYFSRLRSDWITCSIQELDFQLSHLKCCCRVVPLIDGLKELERGATLAPRTVALTVDDVDESFFKLAWPIFRTYRVPLLCNVITGFIGQKIPHVGGGIQLAGEKALEELLSSGLVTLGSHSSTHPEFHRLDPAQVFDEISSSKRMIETLQGSCDIFSYPYGNASVLTPEAEHQLVESGYAYALTTRSGPVKRGTDRLRIGRTNITGSRGRWQFPFYCNGLLSKGIQVRKTLRGERLHSRFSPGGRIGFGLLPKVMPESKPIPATPSASSTMNRQPVIEVLRSSPVSVVIPCYNNASCLPRAVRSALEQTLCPFEVIVVDDGSTDGSTDVLKTFGQRVTSLDQSNSGPAAARNTGIRHATGSLVAFLDADDYWQPEFLARCATFLQKHPETLAVSTGLCFRLRSGKCEIGPPILRSQRLREPFVIRNFFDFWAKQDHIRTGSCVIRHEALVTAGYQRAELRLAEDLELWGLLATYGKWGFIPEVLWYCDSERVAAQNGWLQKHFTRWKMCPSVELWQERIARRLKPEDWPKFREIRGRVAVIFAHNHVLAGHYGLAKNIVTKYGAEMPPVWSACLLRVGNWSGRIGWLGACLALRCREYQKAWAMHLRAENPPRVGTAETDHASPSVTTT